MSSKSATGAHARLRLLRNRTERRMLAADERIWSHLPPRLLDSRTLRRHGMWLHALVSESADREMYLGTQFLRNRPALELMRRLIGRKNPSRPTRIAVLGCSIGAEVYSIVWALRGAAGEAPEFRISAIDISGEAIAHARRGAYGPVAAELVSAPIFAALADAERAAMFDWEGPSGKVKPWMRAGIDWRVGDACDPELVARLGPQDMVVANNFLCHMPPAAARECLRSIARLVTPGGHLFVSGVDLDVRTQVARELGWEPVAELREQIHDGDQLVRADWPWRWWGLEPMDTGRSDWELRYSAVFRIGGSDATTDAATEASAPAAAAVERAGQGIAGPAGPAMTPLKR